MSYGDLSKRRSAAAQFFMDDDNISRGRQNEDEDEEEEGESKSSQQKVVDWINDASVTTDVNKKVQLLHLVQEVIIHKEPDLIDNFLHEVIAFQTDRSADVRKFVVGFIEEACKKDWDLLFKVIRNLQILLQDTSPPVQKRVIQACCSIYKGTLGWLSKAKNVTDEMQGVWMIINTMKHEIIAMVDSDNDGIRTIVVKFLEMVVLCQTYPEADSYQRGDEITLEAVPLGLKIARRRKLEEEAKSVFDLMVKFHGSAHISAVNLMTCMGSLSLIARMRPSFMGKVIAALETLHINLPPTLTKSQVSSVRKHLKVQLLSLLKHPSGVTYLTNITTLLTDLGATYHEVMKAYPKVEDFKRKSKRSSSSTLASSSSSESKKPRIEETRVSDSGFTNESAAETAGVASSTATTQVVTETAVDITEQFIVERLSPELAADLVIKAMSKLPNSMPSVFSATYTPIAAAGTQGQIRHVARLLATHLNAAGLGPGAVAANKRKTAEQENNDDDEDDEYDENAERQIGTVLTVGSNPDKNPIAVAALPEPLQPMSKSLKLKSLKLSKITRPLSHEMQDTMAVSAVMRILNAEKSAIVGGVVSVRSKMIATMATTFTPTIRQAVLNYILTDIRNNLSLGLAWLYEEYSYMQGFKRLPAALTPDIKKKDQNYNALLLSFIQAIINRHDVKEKDSLLMRLFLEAPIITDEATDMLKELCCREHSAINILQELVIRRPPRQLLYLNAMLTHTAHENPEQHLSIEPPVNIQKKSENELTVNKAFLDPSSVNKNKNYDVVRETAIKCVVTLYDRGELRSIIEEYAVLYLSFLRLPQPPDVLFGEEHGRVNKGDGNWSEDAAKACLYLYLVLLPINQTLVHELARVYVQTVADVKRIILRLVESPVRGMGMDSPQLLSLVEECPKGAETLVTRVIHILTDKVPPSAELVARVRELYHTRVSDVRFLIPVLNGLSKKEIIAALPKLMKLNPVVVKEVFNRLLGTHTDTTHHSSPITPAELLIALHTIDPSKCELKTVMKATSLCFNEKQAYTQEVLAVVMQNLMEITPLPTLLMRTVIQSLSLYPRLIGFVINILQRLILKQVWRQKKVWEGFIKCCQRTKPQSFQVLLQLPAPQLQDVFEYSPDLKQPLLEHVMSFTDNQRAHIPQAVMDILMGPDQPIYPQYTVKSEPMSPTELTIDIKEESDTPPTVVPPNEGNTIEVVGTSKDLKTPPVQTQQPFSEPAPPGLE